MEILGKIIEKLWGINTILLVGGALFFTYRTKFVQLRYLPKIISTLFEKSNGKGVSSLEAFLLGTACRVGAGNIVGVVAAVVAGGPGAVFWMWLVAFLGAATSFVESTLAVKYREKIGRNEYRGGTPWIIEKRLGFKWLACIYVIASLVCYMGVVQVMSNSITTSIYEVKNMDMRYPSIILTILVASIIFYRTKKDSIIVILNKMVPVMAILYIVVAIIIVVKNITFIPEMIKLIITSAFGVKSVVGAGFGVVAMEGVKRGLFSNEAGSGNSNYAAAVANVDEPYRQGFAQVLGVFVDTLIICSVTAFIVLLSDVELDSKIAGMALFQKAIKYHIGWIGVPFTVTTLFFFSLSTILGVAYYGKNAISYLDNSNVLNHIYCVFIVVMVYLGGVQKNDLIWILPDLSLGIMTFINILVLFWINRDIEEELEKIL